MRTRLDAPLIYAAGRNGYEYEDKEYELPPVWFSEEELLAFCLALRLSTAIPDKDIKNTLHQFLEKFLSVRSADIPPVLNDIDEKVSVKNIQYSHVDEAIFHKVVSYLFQNKPMKIIYRTPHKKETTQRIVVPLHLLCYMGSWHLIAFCSLRKGLRDFALSRIERIEPIAGKCALPAGLPPIKEYIRKNFGIMNSAGTFEVCLRFSKEIAPWVLEQIWHPKQKMQIANDKTLCLTFPVADFREIKREILKYGAQVEVISPEKLRKEVQQEIEKMKKIYPVRD